MNFYRPRRRNEISTGALSSAIDDNINGRNTSTPLLTGGISNSYYPSQQEQTQAQNPSLTGTYSTIKDIKGFTSGGSGAGASGGGGVPWGAIASGVKTGFDTLFDKKDENGYDDYSDFEQTMIYPGMGAAYGSTFGPWGALGGAAYGLGYSFKDDIGLDDNNWLTTMIFPIGMGDEHQGLLSL